MASELAQAMLRQPPLHADHYQKELQHRHVVELQFFVRYGLILRAQSPVLRSTSTFLMGIGLQVRDLFRRRVISHRQCRQYCGNVPLHPYNVLIQAQ